MKRLPIAILAVLIAGVVTSAIGQVPIGDFPYPTETFPLTYGAERRQR